MSTPEIEAIEKAIRNAKTILDTAGALDRLKKNKDFKDVVMKGYFREEAIRLVHLKANNSMQDPEAQKSILNQIDAIGHFCVYMDNTYKKAEQAAKIVEDGPDLLNECYLEQEELA
mgnify:FL=1